MESKVRLVLNFKDADGKSVSISVDSPREDVTETEIVDVMNLIVEKDIFAPGGVAIASAVDAKIIETNTTTHDLEL